MYIVINDFTGFTQYLLFVQNSESGLFETNVCNALQIILVFLSDVPESTHKMKMSKHSAYMDKIVLSTLRERRFLRQSADISLKIII